MKRWRRFPIIAFYASEVARDAVIPEDVQAVLPGVASHRLQAVGEFSKQNSDVLVRELLEAVAIP